MALVADAYTWANAFYCNNLTFEVFCLILWSRVRNVSSRSGISVFSIDKLFAGLLYLQFGAVLGRAGWFKMVK